MAINVLNGIKITPHGNRFAAGTPWPTGYAFGGWIYSIDCAIGFSNEPTTLTVKIALANLGDGGTDYSPTPGAFDINKNDIYLTTQAGVENLFDIEVDGRKFESFVLFSYDKTLPARDKVLSVVFKDYSIILDKIYVGLTNRQGNKKVYSASATGVLPIKCGDCQFTGSSFVHSGELSRFVDTASYVGANGRVMDNFSPVVATMPYGGMGANIFDLWHGLSGKAFAQPPTFTSSSENFNLNGGYLIIGTEDISQENCGALPEVKYSFPELIWSTKIRGIDYKGDFPSGYSNRSLYYKQNYIGTLREVLQNWCSDFALSFYTSGKSFVGLDVSSPVDILQITGILDPNTTTGGYLDFSENSAVSDYKEEFSLNNSYKQSVITYNVRPATTKTDSKTIQRHVGYRPLHPIEFNLDNRQVALRTNAYGVDFFGPSHVYNWDVCSPATITTTTINCPTGPPLSYIDAVSDRLDFRFANWTARNFDDIDISIALSKYSQTLRDIFIGRRIIQSLAAIDANRDALYSNLIPSFQIYKDNLDAHFKTLGFHPLTRIIDSELKALVIEKNKNAAQGNTLDQSHFEVFIGYYYPEERQQISDWERGCSESMYKYALLTQGTTVETPYTVDDLFYNLSPSAGLSYGEKGIKRTTYSHEYEPATKQYPLIQDAPFKNLLVFENRYTGVRYTGSYFTEIDNMWGTPQEVFDAQIEFEDTRCQQYNNIPNVNESLTNLYATVKQTWDMSFFAPSFSDTVNELFEDFRPILESLSINNQIGADQISTSYFDFQGQRHSMCKKMQFLIVPITCYPTTHVYAGHPNGFFGFSDACHLTNNPQMLRKYNLDVIEEQKRIKKEKVPSLCDVSIGDELCRKGLAASGLAARAAFDPKNLCDVQQGSGTLAKFYCDINPTGRYRVGFHPSYISGNNSRRLDITISRNPFINSAGLVPTDSNGDYYIEDLTDVEALSIYPASTRATSIIYPINTQYGIGGRGTYDESGQLYYGLMKTTVSTETRQPKTVEIHGEPTLDWNPTAGVKVINNEINPDIDPFLNGLDNQFLVYTSLITGANMNSVITVKAYHDVISGLNNYQSTGASQSINMTITGPTARISPIIDPRMGLTSFSMAMGEAGMSTQLEFKSKPKTLAKQETILNKITSRLKK